MAAIKDSKSSGRTNAAPTITQLARLCGISKGTVSKALNGRESLVAESTRLEVLRVAESIGFKPSWHARALARKRSQVIAVLHSSHMGVLPRSSYWTLSEHLDRCLSAHDYSMMFVPARTEYERLDQMLSDGRFDGVLCLGTVDAPVIKLLKEGSRPVVMLNPSSDGMWALVKVDDAGGTRLAMQHLFDLGHRRIVFRSNIPVEHASYDIRRNTVRQCMVDAGLAPIEAQALQHDEFAAWLVAQSKDSRPTAVVDYAHWSAVGMLTALWRVGIQVPRDLSVVTFNDEYPVAETIPPLTVVALPSKQMAEVSVELLIDRIEGRNDEPADVVLPEQLVIRESTRALSKSEAI
jgi:DNA-binding LacI/PurR family transcriptional regulator